MFLSSYLCGQHSMKMKRRYVKLGLQIFLLQPELIGSEFIETAGFMEVADSNDMVIIFPSTIARALIANPGGCFNWFGYLGDLVRQFGVFPIFCHFLISLNVGLKGVKQKEPE